MYDWSEEEIAHILRLAGVGKLPGRLRARQTIELVGEDGGTEVIVDREVDDLPEIARIAELAGVPVPKPALASTVRTGAEMAAAAQSEEAERHAAVRGLVDRMREAGADVADIFDAVVEMLVRDWTLARDVAEREALDLLDDLVAESWDPRATKYGDTKTWKPSRMGIERQSRRHIDNRYTKHEDNPIRPLPEPPFFGHEAGDRGDED